MNIKKNILVFMLAAGVAFSAAAGTRDSSKSWKDTASEMKVIIDDAYSLYINGNADAGYERVNDAYFGHYEVDGFERNTQSRIGGSRFAGLVFYFYSTGLSVFFYYVSNFIVESDFCSCFFCSIIKLWNKMASDRLTAKRTMSSFIC